MATSGAESGAPEARAAAEGGVHGGSTIGRAARCSCASGGSRQPIGNPSGFRLLVCSGKERGGRPLPAAAPARRGGVRRTSAAARHYSERRKKGSKPVRGFLLKEGGSTFQKGP